MCFVTMRSVFCDMSCASACKHFHSLCVCVSVTACNATLNYNPFGDDPIPNSKALALNPGHLECRRPCMLCFMHPVALFCASCRRSCILCVMHPVAGLVAFDFPLGYLRKDQLHQPIFGCNNLSGQSSCLPYFE